LESGMLGLLWILESSLECGMLKCGMLGLFTYCVYVNK
jgi:hypothetical protein